MKLRGSVVSAFVVLMLVSQAIPDVWGQEATARPAVAPYQALCQASWYGERHRGLLMANGQPFNPDRLTAASWFYPIGTKVVVTHAGRSVVVKVTDRGPAKRLVNQGRKIDLSRAAFARLAPTELGLIDVVIQAR